MLGPTREPERMSMHRNYHVIDLAKMVGCEPCFERMVHCKGAIRCMNEPKAADIVRGIEEGVKDLVSS